MVIIPHLLTPVARATIQTVVSPWVLLFEMKKKPIYLPYHGHRSGKISTTLQILIYIVQTDFRWFDRPLPNQNKGSCPTVYVHRPSIRTMDVEYGNFIRFQTNYR